MGFVVHFRGRVTDVQWQGFDPGPSPPSLFPAVPHLSSHFVLLIALLPGHPPKPPGSFRLHLSYLPASILPNPAISPPGSATRSKGAEKTEKAKEGMVRLVVVRRCRTSGSAQSWSKRCSRRTVTYEASVRANCSAESFDAWATYAGRKLDLVSLGFADDKRGERFKEGLTIERQELPAWPAVNEALRPELVGVVAPEVEAAVHEVDAVADVRAGGDVDRRGAVGSAAEGQRGVALRSSRVEGHNGVQAQDLVDGVLQVLAAFQCRKRDVGRVLVRAEGLEDGRAELGEDFGVAGEQVEEPGEQAGGGVSAGEEDVEELGAQLDRVARLLSQCLEENVAFFFTGFALLLLLGGAFLQRQIYIVRDELVDHSVVLAEFKAGDQPVEVAHAEALREPFLRRIKVDAEGMLVRGLSLVTRLEAGLGQLTVDALTEQKLAGGGVSAGEEDVEELGAQLDRVARLLSQCLEENVAFFFTGFALLLLLGGAFLQRQIYIVRDELVDHSVVLAEFKAGDQPVEVAHAEALREPFLRRIKVDAEGMLVRGLSLVTRLEAGLAIRLHGQNLQQVLDVGLFQLQVADLVTHEVGPEQRPRMRPRLPVLDEDAVAQGRQHVAAARRPQMEVVELRGQHGLDVLGVGGEILRGAEHVDARGGAHTAECLGARPVPFKQEIGKKAFPVRGGDLEDVLEPQEATVECTNSSTSEFLCLFCLRVSIMS
nr:hypothetical protein CFP56_64903 [Quercus suber]